MSDRHFIMLIFSILLFSWIWNCHGLLPRPGQIPRKHCPQRYSRHGSYCFSLTDKTTMTLFSIRQGIFEQPFCKQLEGRTFSVKTWEDQRAAEAFLRAHGVHEKVWLRGMVEPLEHRAGGNTFYWPDNLHPKIQNFVHPDAVQNMDSSFFRGCVAMDPENGYKWLVEPCFLAKHKALCSIRISNRKFKCNRFGCKRTRADGFRRVKRETNRYVLN